MLFEIGPSLVGMWGVNLGTGNWLASLTRLPDGRYKVTYRFRWYRDDKIFDRHDEKNWYSAETKGTDEVKAISVIRGMFEKMLEPLERPGWELLRGQRTPEEFLKDLLKMPGMHSQEHTVQ